MSDKQSTEIEKESTSDDIARKAGRGVLWNLLSFGIGKASLIITTAILARLLTKNDFGLVSIAVIGINYLSIIKDLGLGVALIQRRGDIEKASNTVFTINLILGLLLSVLSFLLAPWIATFFKEPEVIPVLRWLGLSFVINALGSVHTAWLIKELDFQKKIIPDMGNSIIKLIASILMAYAGFGVWALVFGQLIGSLVSVILLWVITPWRPQLVIHTNIASQLLHFGSFVTIGEILGVTIDNLDYIIVGRIFGSEPLSVYQLAYRLPEAILVGNLWVIGSIAFPTFSTLQNNMLEMKKAFLVSIRFVQMLALPISFGLFLAADPIVRVVFGDGWLDVIPILRVLSIYSLIYSFSFHVGDIYKAIGKPYLLVRLSILQLVILIPALLVGASYYGPVGVAWGHVFTIFIKRIVGLMVAMNLVKVKPTEIFSQYKPSFLAILAMAPVVVFTLYFTNNLSDLIQLTLTIVFGAGAYLLVLWQIEKNMLIQLSQKVFLKK